MGASPARTHTPGIMRVATRWAAEVLSVGERTWTGALLVVVLVLSACGGASGRPEGEAGAGDPCADAFAAAAAATPIEASDSDLDVAIRRCRDLESWRAGALASRNVLQGVEPDEFLASRCADPAAGLGGYQVCGMLRIANATPSPTPRPTRRPRPTPSPTPRRTPRPTARPTPRPDVSGYRSAVCGAARTLRTDVRTLGTWQDLPDIKANLDYELAIANLFTPGSTPSERYSRWAAAVAGVEAEWDRLRRSLRADANDILLDVDIVSKALAQNYRWPAGSAARKRLAAVASRVASDTRSLRTWLKKHESSTRLTRILRSIDTTQRRLASAVRALPVDCV